MNTGFIKHLYKLSGIKVRPRCRQCRSNNVYYSNGKRYRTAGRLRWSGQASGSGSGAGRVVRRVGTMSGQARVKSQENEKRETGEKQELTQMLVDKQDELAQINREHRYKYTGDNGEEGRHLEVGGDSQRQVKQIRVCHK
jgi:hypothetical protein